jgi:signal transduction histidine kinase
VTVWGEEAGDLVRLCVTDTGCGISPQDMDRLWDRFFRVATAGAQTQGTGLGLPIVKRIAGLHGGDVGVSSTPGEGSTFWISLPRYRPQD